MAVQEMILEHAGEYHYHSCDVKRKIALEDELDNGVRLIRTSAIPLTRD